jgi:hypothetical protein
VTERKSGPPHAGHRPSNALPTRGLPRQAFALAAPKPRFRGGNVNNYKITLAGNLSLVIDEHRYQELIQRLGQPEGRWGLLKDLGGTEFVPAHVVAIQRQ